MKISSALLGLLILIFIAVLVILNLPGAKESFEAYVPTGQQDTAGAMIAIVTFLLAGVIWFGAYQHLLSNSSMSEEQRSSWRFALYGGLVFGAIAYFWVYVRREPRK